MSCWASCGFLHMLLVQSTSHVPKNNCTFQESVTGGSRERMQGVPSWSTFLALMIQVYNGTDTLMRLLNICLLGADWPT